MQSVATWARAFQADPVNAILHAIQTAEAANPQHAQALRSHFARQLGAQRRAPEPVADPEPEPDLQSADGTLVYSAPAQKVWREWNNRQMQTAFTKQLKEELQPLQTVAQTFKQREQQAQAFSEVSGVLTEFRADPDFKANEADIKAQLAKDPRLAALADSDPKTALELAFARVRLTKLVPEQLKQSEGKTLAHLQQRAVAATQNPATASTTTPKQTLGNARAALEHASQQLGAS